MRKRLSRGMRPAVMAAAVICVVLGGGVAYAGRFGVGCQSNYAGGWQTTLPYVWERCSEFGHKLNDYDTWVFYWNLDGGKWWWEKSGDEYGPDTVDLFYASTHGGGWYNDSVWAMFNANSFAYSTNMRLGDESWGTQLMSTYACETMKFNDGRMWVRLGPIMRGGLKYITGSHDKLYDSYYTAETGEDYAYNLQHGWSIKNAWYDGNSDWYSDQDTTVMTTGVNQGDCDYRRWYMSWWNMGGYSRLRDNQIGWYCYYYWDNT